MRSDLNKVIEYKIGNDIGSDHLLIILKLNLGAKKNKNMYKPHWIYQKCKPETFEKILKQKDVQKKKRI